MAFGLARWVFWSDAPAVFFFADGLALATLAGFCGAGCAGLYRAGWTHVAPALATASVAAVSLLPWLGEFAAPMIVGSFALVLLAGFLPGLLRERGWLLGGHTVPLALFAAGVGVAAGAAYLLPERLPAWWVPPALAVAALVLAPSLLPAARTAWLAIALPAAGLALLAVLPAREPAPPAFEPGPAVARGETMMHQAAAAEIRPTSVVLIVLDTLRRDRMSLYGYGRATTPGLENWARDARVFEDATAPSSWTIPSHASIFTGLHPRSHGARLERVDEGYEPRGLDESFDTLAEIAVDHGVQTAAISSNFAYGHLRHGMAQGFESWSAHPHQTRPRFEPVEAQVRRLLGWPFHQVYTPLHLGDPITESAIEWLDWHRKERFFLFVNYMDVHMPTFLRTSPEIQNDDELDDDHLGEEVVFELLRDPQHRERAARTLGNRYDRHLIRLDRAVTRLLSHIEASGLASSTTVIVTSDHGEYLGERGLAYHVIDLHPEVVNVPLLVRGPNITPGRSRRPTSLVDLFPTILASLGIEAPDNHGTLLEEPRNEPLVSELYGQYKSFLWEDPTYALRFDRRVRSIRFDRFRYLEYSNGHRELYDLSNDPKQRDNLAATRPDLVARGAHELRRWLTARPDFLSERTLHQNLDPAEAERLRALGYLD